MLLFYRLLILGLLAVIAFMGIAIKQHLSLVESAEMERAANRRAAADANSILDGKTREEITVVDLVAKVEELNRTKPGSTDEILFFFVSDVASVHLHAIGDGQRCPMHLHKKTEEFTALISGTARVTHLHDGGGKMIRTPRDAALGHGFGMKPNSAHEWVNTSANTMQGNLVFAHPGFDGNLFVADDNPAMLGSGEPVVYDAQELLREFANGTEPHSITTLPVLGGWLSSQLVRTSHTFEPAPHRMTLAYVTGGGGALLATNPDGAVEEHPLQPGTLARFRTSSSVEFRAGDDSLAMVVFEPSRP